MIYQFAQIYYLLLVKKVDVTNANGYRKVARNAKLVFEAYEPAEGGSGPRYGERRIAQTVYQVFTEGHWHTVEVNDRLFLEAFGLMPDMNPSVNLEAELIGRRIMGLPGPPDPDGYNPLLEFQVIADALDATTIEPLIRKPNVRGQEGYRPIHQAKPRWDRVLRRLTWNGNAVASYRRSAPNQATILSVFEEEGWPPQIDDPLPQGILRQTLKDLQEKFRATPIAFIADGTGTGIRWEPRTT